jgi:hypothetical protein
MKKSLNSLDKNILGIVLIVIIASIYSFYNYDQVNKKELVKIKGVLRENPTKRH